MPSLVRWSRRRKRRGDIRTRARALADQLVWLPNVRSSRTFATRCRILAPKLARALHKARNAKGQDSSVETLRENTALVESSFSDVYEALHRLQKTPHVRTATGPIVPRALAIAEDYLTAASYRCNESAFTLYIEAFQQVTVLNLAELWTLVAVLKLVLLERLVDDSLSSRGLSSGREKLPFAWRAWAPSTVYLGAGSSNRSSSSTSFFSRTPLALTTEMEAESRDLYRYQVANIAEYSDLTEQEVAEAALELAQNAHRTQHPDPRVAERLSHIGYYLVAEGVTELRKKANFWPPLSQRLQSFITSHPDDLYVPAILLLTAIIAATVVHLSAFDYSSFGILLVMLLVLLLPCSEAAVQIVNKPSSHF